VDELMTLWQSTAIPHFEIKQIIMMLVGFGLLYLAILVLFY